MKLKERFLKIINGIEDSFMTNHSCISCKREIPDGSRYNLCKECLDKIHKIDGHVCKVCGEKILDENIVVCDNCKSNSYEFASNRSCFYYDEVTSKIVKNFKYDREKYLSESISNLMLTRPEFFEDIDILTYVPINKKRMRERGFNQSELLTSAIAKEKGFLVLNLLKRKDGGKHQAGLNLKERLANPANTFLVDETNISQIKGKRVCIIDDVFTTGSTLNECAKMLKKYKPLFVKTVTFAKTDLNSSNKY